MKAIICFLLGAALCTGSAAAQQTQDQQAPQAEAKEPVRHPVVFWELASHDAEASVAFFRETFGWDIEQEPNTILYGVESRSEKTGINGGIFTLQKAKLPFLTVYILVDDIKEKARLIAEHGGYIVEQPKQIASGSWICLFNDPSGVTFAMLQLADKG